MGWGIGQWVTGAAVGVLAVGCAAGEGGDADTEPGTLMSATEGAQSSSSTTATIPNSTSDQDSTTSTTDDSDAGDGSSGGCVPQTWWPDDDGDGYGAAAGSVSDCEQPAGYVDNDEDCDDQNEVRNPGLTETCDGVDNDCDNLRDEASPENTTCNGCEMLDVGGRSYAVCTQLETWSDARSSCAALFTGDLVKIDDTAENDALMAELLALPETGRWWIGLSDVAMEGEFVWIDDSVPAFTNWELDEPNDLEGEDCVEVRTLTDASAWNDLSCSRTEGFICESPGP